MRVPSAKAKTGVFGTSYWQRTVRPFVLKRDRYRCQLRIPGVCMGFNRRLPPDKLEVDHEKPRAAGGKDDFDNLRAACISCNRHRAGGSHKNPPSREWE